MLLHDKIREDVVMSTKAGRQDVGILKYTLGEFNRLKGTKDGQEFVGAKLTDTQAIRVIKRIIESERKLMSITGNMTDDTIQLLSRYLPQTLSEGEVKDWLEQNVDFSTLKNKMQAVGILKKEFGDRLDAKMASALIKDL